MLCDHAQDFTTCTDDVGPNNLISLQASYQISSLTVSSVLASQLGYACMFDFLKSLHWLLCKLNWTAHIVFSL